MPVVCNKKFSDYTAAMPVLEYDYYLTAGDPFSADNRPDKKFPPDVYIEVYIKCLKEHLFTMIFTINNEEKPVIPACPTCGGQLEVIRSRRAPLLPDNRDGLIPV